MSTIKCSRCEAANREGASFCAQCGAPLAATASAEAASAPRQTNWSAIIFVIVVLVVGGWLLFGPSNGKLPASGTPAVSGANPHGGGATTGSGAGDAATAMGDLKLDESKAQLAENPLDTDALSNLYNVYGMIGRTGQVRVYLDAAIAELEAREPEFGDDFESIGIRLGMAAVMGDDLEGGLQVFEKILELRPDYHPAKRMMGDVCLGMAQYELAIHWYTEYLESIGPEEGGRDYWDTYHYRASTYMEWYESSSVTERDVTLMNKCLADLEYITVNQPDIVEAWFSLGHLQNLNGNTEEAIIAWEHARDLSTADDQRWSAEASIARARGEELPPRPASMEGGMGMMGGGDAGGGMSSSHGGM